MHKLRWQKIEKLFNYAITLQPDQRVIFLTNSCGVDIDLRKEILSLLEKLDEYPNFLNESIFSDGLCLLAEEITPMEPA